MKKILVVGLAASLVFGSLATADAAKKKPKKVTRKEEAAYAAPAYFYWAPTGDHIGGVKFATGSNEKFISVEIKDQTGMPVSAGIGQDVDGDGSFEQEPFCTKTDQPRAIEPGYEVIVFVFVGPCTSPPGPAAATHGTVTATFSNLP